MITIVLTRVQQHLANWSRYMRAKAGVAPAPVRGGFGLRGIRHYDTDSGYDKSDWDTAIMVDAIILDMSQLDRDALAYHEGIIRVWPHTLSYADAIEDACELLMIRINRLGLI